MVSTRLILINEQDTNSPQTVYKIENAPTMTDIAVPIDFQIADVRDPGRGSGSKSYTVTLPGTQELNIFFENIFDVNVSLQTFNPNLKVKAYYYVDELEAFRGNLQMTKIRVNEVTKDVFYDCTILGEVVTLFTKIKDLYLTELDFSQYNYALTYANIVASWSNTSGAGVVHPLADWGDNNSDFFNVKPNNFRGCLFKREILNKIFSNAGYTWTSTFLDSAEFKKKIQPPTTPPELSISVMNNNKFLAVTTTPSVHTTSVNPFIAPFGTTVQFQAANQNVVDFQTETYDTGNIYSSNVFTVPVTNYYNVQANLGLTFKIYRNNVDVTANCVALGGNMDICLYESNTATVAGTYSINVADINLQSQNNASLILNNIQLTAGSLYYITVNYAGGFGINYSAATPGATWVLQTTIVNTSNYSAEFTSTMPYEGATIVCNGLLPNDYKQSEFINDLIKEYNLLFMVDRSNPKNIIIEPWPTFYSTTSVNWSEKIDTSVPAEVIPMGELDFIKLTHRHAEDGDFFNQEYLKEFKEPYGTHKEDVTNDFVKSEKVVETKIAPTPYAVDIATGVVIPSLIKKENNNITTLKTKPRSWHWSGSISAPIGINWKFKYNNGANSVIYSTIPAAGHTDNPWSPTLDMCFDEPDKLYFSYPNQVWTDNNLYNRYYSQYINTITDKNSKIVRQRFRLTPTDINGFDFRYPVFAVINGEQGYYIVNKIEEYNPLVNETTMVELLKLTTYAAFVESVNNTGGGGGDNNWWSLVFKQNITKGDNNFNTGSESMIFGGSGNVISNTSESVTMFNSENALASGVDNVFAIGADKDTDFLSKTANFYNSLVVGSPGIMKEYREGKDVYVDFSVDGQRTLYYVSSNYFGTAINCTWDTTTYDGLVITFKMLDVSPGGFIIINDGSPAGQIEFNATPYTTDLITGDSITVHAKNRNLYII